MSTKVPSLLENKIKKKASVNSTKQNPPTLEIRKQNFASTKAEIEKVDKGDKQEKIVKPTLKPSMEVNPKLKPDKNPKLTITANRSQGTNFDSLKSATTTNAIWEQTRKNEQILSKLENHLLANEDNRKRWSDISDYPKRKVCENTNPNCEDNNLVNQNKKIDKAKNHLRNVSTLQNINAQNHEGPKLQDATNTKSVRQNSQARYEITLQNVSQYHKSKNITKKNICSDEQNSKPRVKLIERPRGDLDNIEATNIMNFREENITMQEDFKENICPNQRYELDRLKNVQDEVFERTSSIKSNYNDALKNAKSDSSSSGHTPNYSTNGTNQRLNMSNQSTKSTNTHTSSINKSSITNDNIDRKSIGKISSNTQSSGKSGQITSKVNLMRFGNTFQKYSDHKTDSTYISGGDSTSPVLDCEESLSSNIINLLNTKNDNFSWLDKDEFKMRPLDLIGLETKEPLFGVINERISIGNESMTMEEELDNFNTENTGCAIDPETIDYLIMREMEYAPDPHYFETKQNHITWIMRAILLDWMMEVCMEFTLKRETFHYAVNYVDRYLSATVSVQKWELQLIGVAAMYLASKVEEIYAPKVADFARSADNGYSCQQIIDMELKLMKNLKWFLNPPTLNTWANWYMCQWDLYIEHSEYARNHPLVLSCEDGLIQFKQPNERSYARFREVMQLIDCAILDIQTLQYKPRALIASFLYMTLGKYFKQFSVQQIVEEFPKTSLYLIDQESLFNDLFSDFLQYSFGFQLIDLLPNIQYTSTFLKLPLNFDLPTAAKINKENVLEGHFEEFLAYQTHHPLNIDYIRRRSRNNF